jgi:hypothetical protein
MGRAAVKHWTPREPLLKGGAMVRPLIKKKQNGEQYTRPPGIEAKIDKALGQDVRTLATWAHITDNRSSEYLPSECLVHLIRDAIRGGDDRVATALMRPLLIRCEANLRTKVSDGQIRNAVALREEVLSSFGLMFAEDGTEGHKDELDYYECKFGSALRTLRIDHVRSEFSRRRELTDLPESHDREGGASFDSDALARLSEMARTKPAQEDRVYLHQVLKAVSELPPDERRAVVLRRVLGYDEESADPSKRTVATICEVEGRTIRNRLSRADKRLKSFKEGQ